MCFGGADATARREDIWEFNNTTWNQVTPTPPPAPQTGTFGPGPREGFGMIYDPLSERVLIAHGTTSLGCQNDAWLWDGQGFTKLLTDGPGPSARRGTQLFYDPIANQLRLFAGGCGTSATSDLWSIALPVVSRNSTFGAGCQGSNGRTLALTVVAGSTAHIGQQLQMQLANVPTTLAAPYLLLGISKTQIQGLPLPMNLSLIGLPGCTGYSSADLKSPMTLANTTGISSWTLNIPNGSYLLGMELHLQGLCFEIPSFSRWGSVSNAITARIGNR